MKLTDRIQASGASLTDLIHIVITSDTSQNSAGSSYKIPMSAYVSLFGGSGASGDYWISGSTWNGANYPIKANNDTLIDATGDYAVAEGNATLASGNYSHAEGILTSATNDGSHAEGQYTTASGDYSHAEGSDTKAIGIGGHSEGSGTTASGSTSHAEGSGTTANGGASHAEGQYTTASGIASHTEGYLTIASGDYNHAEGIQTISSGTYGSHAEGYVTTSAGQASHSEGQSTKALGNQSHAEGANSLASGQISHAEGYLTTAQGAYGHSEGYRTSAFGQPSHAEGEYTTASGNRSHSEGYYTIALGAAGHAEGWITTASADYSHAEGISTIASGQASHSEGSGTTASGIASHAGGYDSIASGDTSFVHGNNSIAVGENTIVLGANLSGTTSDTTYTNKVKSIYGVSTGTLDVTGVNTANYTEFATPINNNGYVNIGNANVVRPYGLTANSPAGYIGGYNAAYWDRDTAFNLTHPTYNLVGVDGAVYINTSATTTVGHIIGVRSSLITYQEGPIITDSDYFKCNAPNEQAMYGMQNVYGFHMEPHAGIPGFTAGTTNLWGVYIDDVDAKNYFGNTVGIGTNIPYSGSILELESTTKALVITRMTDTQASAITPINGMMLYVTTIGGVFISKGFWGYEEGVWVKL